MIAYFDCFSGISGDMTLGALVDAGAPIEDLRKDLSRLPVRDYELSNKRVKRAGMVSTKVDVNIKKKSRQNEHRKWNDVKGIIERSKLKKDIKQKGLSIFKRLFQAEAKVHGSRYDRVHLHELAAVDCIVDIFGTLIGLDILNIDQVYSSPVNVGNGNVLTSHGLLPVPAPATIELLKKRPVYSSDTGFELTTPTGAALISTLASEFGPLPYMSVQKTGVGAGNRNVSDWPNVLRVFIGNESGSLNKEDKIVVVIETNIDDMSPQIYEYVIDKLFEKGALDVFLTQIIMKKGRPGIKLTVLCKRSEKESLIDIILNQTTSIGLRYYEAEREILDREIQILNSKYGKVRMKTSLLGKGKHKTSFEYDDCKKIAKKLDIPLIEVMRRIGT